MTERLRALAAALYLNDLTEDHQWRQTHDAQLLQRGQGDLRLWLRGWRPTASGTCKLRRLQLSYFDDRQKRMDYPAISGGLADRRWSGHQVPVST